MRDEVGPGLDQLARRGESMASALPSSSLDTMNRRYGLRGVRPLRKVHAKLKHLDARRRLQAKLHARRASTSGEYSDFSSTYIFDLSPDLDLEAVARNYARDPAVVYAEPDWLVRTVLIPDDPFFASSGAWRQPFDDLWGVKLIDAPSAWDSARGTGVIIAITDTGIDREHPDIAANTWINGGEIPENGLDDDDNGFVDDRYGWNFVADSSDVSDDHGHGTHVAGTAAAVGNNATGIIGVAWEAKVMAVKGFDAGGSGAVSKLADAILYATENGAQVINASWQGPGESETIDEAIESAHAAGVVFVAAAGNLGADLEEAPGFPANNERVITVAASNHLDELASFSNFGRKVDVIAPGGGDASPGFESYRSVLSLASSGAGSAMTGDGKLIVEEGYLRQAGTSMASPHVAGAAAVILSAHPEYTPAQVRQALRVGADDIGVPGPDLDSGYGRLNVGAAVALTALDVDLTSPGFGVLVLGNEIEFVGSAAGSGFSSYRLEYGSGLFPDSWIEIGQSSTPVRGGPLLTWDASQVPDGDYVVRLVAESVGGQSFEDRIPLTLDRVAIIEPEAISILRPTGPVAIRGSAAGGDFQGFRVEWRVIDATYTAGPWRTDGVTLSGQGAAPILDGLLATLDPSVFTENSNLDLRVTVTRSADEESDGVRQVILDPTLKAGWPQQLPGFPEFYHGLRLRHHMTVADLDANGTVEILASYGDQVWALQHDGSMLPGWPQTLDTDSMTPFNMRAPAAADLDGDGRLEVVAAAGLDIFVWHHDGSAMAGWPKRFVHPYSGNSARHGGPRGDFVLADVDNDGARDIVAVIGPALYVLDRNGNPLPGWPQTFPEGCEGVPHCLEDVVAVGDVDGDGTKEIAAVGEQVFAWGPLALALFAHDGSVMERFPRKLLGNEFWPRILYAPIMADVDGDLDLEIIVVLLNKKRVKAFHHTGRRVRLGPRPRGARNRMCFRSFPRTLEPPTAGDLDGDGLAEIFVGNQTRREKHLPRASIFCLSPKPGPDYIHRLTKRGRATSGWPVEIPYPAGDNTYGPGTVAIGDIDGDESQDIVSGAGICGNWERPYRMMDHQCFTVDAYDAQGQRLPGFPKATPGPGTTIGMTPAIADLDGNGLKEIAWIDFYGNVLVWEVPGTAGPELSDWPMYRRDAAHTGALPALR